MNPLCPRPECSSRSPRDPESKPIVRNGYFRRRSDAKIVPRFFCRACRSYFSDATLTPERYQKKRMINGPLFELYDSTMSQRRLARFFHVSRRTVVRKIRLLASGERIQQQAFLEDHYRASPLKEIQFDDLETAEHTKCKPLSVTLAVDPQTRKILAFRVASMPAKGRLAEISRKKYGPRVDERPSQWDSFFSELRSYVTKDCVWTSDENPFYPRFLKRHHPEASHVQVKGGRGSNSGYGELKKLRFDPLFSLNHTCAMLRANMNRLLRRSWCLSKNKQGLIDHLSLYVSYHNRVLTPPIRI
jgi:transposase-like protein